MSTDEPILTETSLTPKVRMQRIALAIAALLYALFCYLNDDFYLFSKHGKGTHFKGLSAGLLECMMVFAALACVLPVIGLYDKRDAKPDYERLRRYSAMTSCGLMACGIFFEPIHPTLLPVGATGSWLLRGAGWLGLGLLFAQLGRLPPSYLKPEGKSAPGGRGGKTSAGIAYFAAFLVALMALACFAFNAFLISRRPDLLTRISPDALLFWVPLAIGLAMAYWSYSIVRRSMPPPVGHSNGAAPATSEHPDIDTSGKDTGKNTGTLELPTKWNQAADADAGKRQGRIKLAVAVVILLGIVIGLSVTNRN